MGPVTNEMEPSGFEPLTPCMLCRVENAENCYCKWHSSVVSCKFQRQSLGPRLMRVQTISLLYWEHEEVASLRKTLSLWNALTGHHARCGWPLACAESCVKRPTDPRSADRAICCLGRFAEHQAQPQVTAQQTQGPAYVVDTGPGSHVASLADLNPQIAG